MSATTAVTLPVLPLSAGVVLPQLVVTIALETDEARAAASAARAHGTNLLLVPRLPGPDGTPGALATVGTIATIETAGELPNGRRALVVRGLQRAYVRERVPGPLTDASTAAEAAATWVEAEPVLDGAVTPHVRDLATEYRALVQVILEKQGASRLIPGLAGIDEPGVLADTVSYWPDLSFERRVQLLETVDVAARLELALVWVREALAEVEVRQRIRSDVAEGIEKQQREYLLRQQMAAIRKELGESDATGDAVADYRRRIEAAGLPDDARKAAEREVDRLERMSEQSPEQSWVRTWLDTLLDVPWSQRSTDTTDVVAARAVLDNDTTGLDDGKDRIVEWLAVRKLRAERGLDTMPGTGGSPSGRRGDGAIIALVGPPGVGKTSLGESVARAMGRRFVRVALGGIRDEAEIRGHRRTYVGAQAGRIVRALREAGTMNPVVLLDEIDKLAAGWSGDPSAALLEVLDPAQNHTFRDHYLEVDLDLSEVVFIATANTLDTIPAPLLDRMEVIPVDGYTDAEKVAIARNHLLGRQLAANGLREDEVGVSDAALRLVIEGYTREAGVRGLERELGKALRKVATRVAADPSAAPVRIDSADDVRGLLGRARRTPEEISSRTAVPGVATGLAVTGAGGDVLFVEATAMPGSGETSLTVTGQLGDVMKESASIALSYVRSRGHALGVPADALEGRRLHVHFPAGAVPKDGPSAGVTMTTALVSLLTGRPVRSTVGMTGEITLQGRVLPIGGVKQKLLAAHRAGLTTVVLPARNEADLDDVPEDVRAALDIHLVDDVAEVVALALEPDGLAEARTPAAA